MATKNVTRRTPATESNQSPTPDGRPAREGEHVDSTEAQTNNPPNHGRVTNSPGAMFLEDADPETPVDELGDAYRAWKNQRGEGVE